MRGGHTALALLAESVDFDPATERPYDTKRLFGNVGAGKVRAFEVELKSPYRLMGLRCNGPSAEFFSVVDVVVDDTVHAVPEPVTAKAFAKEAPVNLEATCRKRVVVTVRNDTAEARAFTGWLLGYHAR